MASRLSIHSRVYRRRISASSVASVLGLGLLLACLPVTWFPGWQEPLVAQEGPLRVLPQIDVLDEPAERQETAAPRRLRPTDFQVVDLEPVDHEVEEERPVPLPDHHPEIPWKEEVLSENDLQNALRTRSVPVLAQSRFRIVHFERPLYPLDALELGIEGTVEVLLFVGRDGRVIQTAVAEPGRLPMLERSALDALARCRFRPHVVGGEAQPFWVKIPVEFELVDRGL